GRVRTVRDWLVSATPRTTEDRTFQLLGLKWARAREAEIDKAAEGLLAEQRNDGGWGQLGTLPSDAYATGEVLVALQQSGAVSTTDPAYRRGGEFLLKTQLSDGPWVVESPSLPVQPYFASGFAEGGSQFMSCFARGWATMALALTAEPLKP